MAPFYPSPPPPLPPFRTLKPLQKSKIIALTFLALATVIGFYISFPLIIVYGGASQKPWTPKGVKCALCEEIWAHDEKMAESLNCVVGDRFEVSGERL